MPNKTYDIIIVGAGCAGYAAAMYSGRFQLSTLVLGDIPGGTIILTDVVENYPGFVRLTGQELADKLKEHAMDYKDFVEMKQEKVIDIGRKGEGFVVTTDIKNKYTGKTIIFATGTKHRELNVPGEKQFSGKGVHVCALCDGFFYKGKVLGVVGGGDSAAKESILLTQWAKKVYMIVRDDTIHPEPINHRRVEELEKQGKIEIIYHTSVKEIKGDKSVSHVVLDKPYKGSGEFKLDGLFVEIGAIPNSELAKKVGVKINDKGEIVIDRESRTNVDGFFAAGDVVDTRFKQAITGVGEAVSASYSAYKYLSEHDVKC